ncbi:transcription factor, contains a PHD finger motif [Microbotryomycetes sp. JL201]|nr:transcription factor, contains a PHD finger motif [Microbotryomycetes sp. JL201]
MPAMAFDNNEPVEHAGAHASTNSHSLAAHPNTPAQVHSEQRAEPANLKRKHSSSATPTAASPAPQHASASLADDARASTSAAAAAPPAVAPMPDLVPPPVTTSLPPSNYQFFATRGRPSTRNGYRYLTCGPSPTKPVVPLPVPFQRMIENLPQGVRYSWEDRSSFSYLTQDAKTVTADKGWRAARANVPLREGNWYWEIQIERGGGEPARGRSEGSWARVGVGRREASLNGPVGFDGYSYGYRDKNGDSCTMSRTQPYGKPFKSGDTIGVYISLPPRTPPANRRDPARIVRKRLPIRYKGQLYFELLEYSSTKEMDDLAADPANKIREIVREKKKAAPGKKEPVAPEVHEPPPRPLPTLPEAKIAFFLNGECQGVAHENLFDYVPLFATPLHRERAQSTDPRLNWHDDGTLGYYPFVSVFGGAIATINSGPEFEYAPPRDIEIALAQSPRPPQTAAVQDPKAAVRIDDHGVSHPEPGRHWRPLCERYVEFLAEQRHLDDLDEQQAIQTAQELAEKKRLAEEAAAARGESHGQDVKPGKKAKTSSTLASSVVQGFGMQQDVLSVGGTPGAMSPAPVSTALPQDG